MQISSDQGGQLSGRGNEAVANIAGNGESVANWKAKPVCHQQQ
jgi:hypothetical protein